NRRRAVGTPARVVGDQERGRGGDDGLPGRRGGVGERAGREGVGLPNQRAALIVEQGDVHVPRAAEENIEPAGLAEAVVADAEVDRYVEEVLRRRRPGGRRRKQASP